MRLIDTSNLTLTEHPDSKLPESGYAILSHRWLDSSDEVTFEDLQQGRDVTHKAGFAKLKNFCEVVASKDYEYAWCDTCCIDKASAVELGSAINSMYRWYKNANVCIAYLHDVSGDVSLEDSVWFRRGWTLQELIAPANLEFYDRAWRSIGTKEDHVEILSSRTKIPISVLKNTSTLPTCSVAQRMSWAADRETERMEDRAYSLLGLFDVSLEMIYGEQEKAFIRLQEKIAQHSADQSIFAWAMDANHPEDKASGLFATSPSAFHWCGNVTKGSESRAFSMTNLGLSISFPAVPYDIETYLAFLDCSIGGNPTSTCAILLSRLKTFGQWARVIDQGMSVFPREKKLLEQLGAVRFDFCVRQDPTSPLVRSNQTYGLWLRTLEPPSHDTAHIRTLTRTDSHTNDRMLLAPGSFGTAGIVYIQPKKLGRWSSVRYIKVGFDEKFQPTIMISNSRSLAFDSKFPKDFDEAENLGPDSSVHRRLFENSWVLTGRRKDNQYVPSIDDDWDKGFNVIVHQRDHWPNERYEFQALDLRIDCLLVPDIRPHVNDGVTNKMIWAIDATTIGETKPERERRTAQCEAWAHCRRAFLSL